MPHALFNPGALAATIEVQDRPLIPGVSPGGSRLGHPMKPALLITGCSMKVNRFDPAGGDAMWVVCYLKLSQEMDMTPGQLLRIGSVGGATLAATPEITGTVIQDDGHQLVGQVWVPRRVGLRFVLANGSGAWDIDVHLDYERIMIPFMDWFIGWDYLDNVVDNDEEY